MWSEEKDILYENDIIYYGNILDPEGRKYEFPDTDIRIYSMTSHHDYAKDSDRVIDIICNLKDQGYTGDYPYRLNDAPLK